MATKVSEKGECCSPKVLKAPGQGRRGHGAMKGRLPACVPGATDGLSDSNVVYDSQLLAQ